METALKTIDSAARLPEPMSRPAERADPLLLNLVILSRLFGNPKSPEALAAGLPIGPEGMTPDLFVRAADRIGLAASIVTRPLGQVSTLTLPAVLLLKERQACVLLSVDGAGGAQIATPDNLDGSAPMPLAELAEL